MMVGGDELGDFSFDAEFAYLDGAEEVEEALLDDGVESDSVNPVMYDALNVMDGLPNLESRQR